MTALVLSFASTGAAADEPDRAPRSKAFSILASTYVTLNALDVYTTTSAIATGNGTEANPVLGGAALHPIALGTLKAASTAATILLAHQVWKKHPAAAILLLVGANAGMSFVVMHNASVIGR